MTDVIITSYPICSGVICIILMKCVCCMGYLVSTFILLILVGIIDKSMIRISVYLAAEANAKLMHY